MLEFIGTGPAYVRHQEEHTTFIDVVSISRVLPNPVLPEIISGPSDIDPTSVIPLEGEHFGVPTGQIKVVFPSHPSAEPFSNASGSMTEFHLKTVGSDTFAESDTPRDVAHPQGAVDSQRVDITLATASGEQTSNVWHANFHNKAVITSGPNTITPGR